MTGMPIFVRIDEYKDVLEVMDLLNKKLAKAKEIIENINGLKAEEDAELEMWQRELADVEKKISFMNHSLTEPKM